MGLVLFMAERLETSSTATSSTNISLPLILTGVTEMKSYTKWSYKEGEGPDIQKGFLCLCLHDYLSNLILFIYLFFWNCIYCVLWVFASSPGIFCNTVDVFPLDPDLCAMLKNSSAYLQSLVDIKTQAEAPRLTYTGHTLTNMATEANRHSFSPPSSSSALGQLSAYFCPSLLLPEVQLKGGNGGLTEACHFMHFHLRDSEWERNGQACQM